MFISGARENHPHHNSTSGCDWSICRVERLQSALVKWPYVEAAALRLPSISDGLASQPPTR